MTSQSPRCYSYVRFSTPDQLRGDSLRRQRKLSEEYAEKHGLELDQTLSLKDLGISAFKGEHRTRGELGVFLDLVKKGRVPKGSVLLVESLDRLSREQVLEAFDQFREIIRCGVKIVTLADNMEYSEETLNANIGQLMISLTIMSRAHEESLMKSKRLSAAWEAKRGRIAEKKLTGICPAWLRLNEDWTKYEKIAERCRAVKRIYEMKLTGKGNERIAQELNKSNVAAWRSKNGWYVSYIQKILNTRAVIGEYQPHRMVNGKREPVGDPIPDYFPRVVTDELFYRVQEQMRRNRFHVGRTGHLHNLFARLIRCGYCNSSMQVLHKGPPPKGGTYLVCDRAKRKAGCHYHSLQYPEFEELVLTFCKGLNVEDLLSEEQEKESVLSELEGELAAFKGKLAEADTKVANLTDSIAGTEDQRVRKQLEARLAEILDEREALTKKKDHAEQTILELTHTREDAGEKVHNIKELIEFMKTQKGQRLFDVRLKLRNELRGLIEQINVFPVGNPRITPEYVQAQVQVLRDNFREDTKGLDESISRYESYWSRGIDNKDLRQFSIFFKGGSFRTIRPPSCAKLTVDYDRDMGRHREWFVDEAGKVAMREDRIDPSRAPEMRPTRKWDPKFIEAMEAILAWEKEQGDGI